MAAKRYYASRRVSAQRYPRVAVYLLSLKQISVYSRKTGALFSRGARASSLSKILQRDISLLFFSSWFFLGK